MVRREDVTLKQTYELVRKDGFAFAFWTVDGNFLGLEIPVMGENVKTRVFISETIFILALSVEIDGFSVMASKFDFLDIWSSMERKYPKLFGPEVKGEVMLVP